MKYLHLLALGLASSSAVLFPLQTAAHGSHGAAGGSLGGASGIITAGAQIISGPSLSVQYERRDSRLRDEQQLLDLQGLEDVHQHRRSEALYLSLAMGLTPDWDMSFSLPYVRYSDFVDNGDAYAQANSTLSRTDTSKGVGDLSIQARYRFWQEGDQQLAALMGLKLPSGDIRQKTNQGDLLGTHNQPGSGSVDFQVGVAYSGFYQDIAAISADVIGRINTAGAGEFRAGNALQADLALSFMPQQKIVPFIEFNLLHMERDIENNAVKRNSGLSSLSLTPGMFVHVGKQQSVYGAISYPVWEELPGIQNKSKYRLLLGYSIGL